MQKYPPDCQEQLSAYSGFAVGPTVYGFRGKPGAGMRWLEKQITKKNSFMKTTRSFFAFVLLTSLLAASPALQNARGDDDHSSKKRITSAVAYHDLWRKLWEEHITWTRMVIMGIGDSLPGTSAYEARLLQNYEDMEDALKPYYGDKAEQLGDLIQDHLLIAVDILNAAKAGDTASMQLAVARWYANGHDIAVLMSKLNSKQWKRSETEQMWRDHLDATLAEATAHLSNDFAADVVAYDKVHDLALGMSDFFSNGIIRQFEGRFTDEDCLQNNR